jgi:nucleotide-binding universal stress UspA family protein
MRNEIVVGLDESPSGKAALDWAAQQAKSTRAVLRAVHALDWPYGLSSAGFPSPMDVTNVTGEEIQESYRQAITAVFDAASPDPDWILQFASGDASQVLVRQSEDARLLVVGTREHVGLGRLLTSSVSHYCLSHALCPVVAVPAPLPERPPGDEDRGPSGIAAPTDQAVVQQIESAGERADELSAPDRTLVVGVDASAESMAAARYAVAAAEMRGGDILLIHAFPAPSARAGDRDAALMAARTKAEELPAAVAAQLVVPPGVKVHTKAEPGDPVAVLEGSAREAAMLVLGRDRVSWGERLLTGAVASRVASQVACTLVVVPGGWRARQAVPRQPVVVALDRETAAEPALKVAFEEARLRDTRLVVLHAEPISAPAREVDAARFDIGVVLSRWKQDHADVAISTAIVAGDPDAQLIRWSKTAAVLVVGRPHEHRWGSWTRSVARTVMRQTHCPLLVAPWAPAEPGPHRALADQALT